MRFTTNGFTVSDETLDRIQKSFAPAFSSREEARKFLMNADQATFHEDYHTAVLVYDVEAISVMDAFEIAMSLTNFVSRDQLCYTLEGDHLIVAVVFEAN